MTDKAAKRGSAAGEEAAGAEDEETRPRSEATVTVDQLGEWSFPASDPPSVWTWEVDSRPDSAGRSSDSAV